MDYPESEMLLKHVEVAVAVKERVSRSQAEGCDQAIDRLPDS
jgi:hypothetical protein